MESREGPKVALNVSAGEKRRAAFAGNHALSGSESAIQGVAPLGSAIWAQGIAQRGDRERADISGLRPESRASVFADIEFRTLIVTASIRWSACA